MPRSRPASAPPQGAPAPVRAPALTRLEVRRLATIEALDLPLAGGFSAFTGETGAGKSIIVDALGLLLGGRGGSDLVRSGEADLLVTAFMAAEGADRTGDEAGGERSVSRRVTAQGRSTARLDGEVVALRELGDFVGEQLTIHWQHSAQSLLTPAHQRGLLDQQLPAEAAAYREAYRHWQEAAARLERLRGSERERARQLDLLGFQAREIAAVAPVPGEEEPLTAELGRLSNLEGIAAGAAGALELLADGEVSAAGLIGEAVRAMSVGARHDSASAQLQGELRGALEAVQAVVGELRGLAEDSAPDPQELDRVETRLSQLGKLRAKYGPELDDVLRFQAQVEADLAELQRDEQDAGTLEADAEALRRVAVQAGETLRAARERLAAPLGRQLEAVIRELGMPHARLHFALTPAQPGPSGLDDVTLRLAANPGEAPGAVGDVASGGELSRVMLAVSTVLGASTPAVVFDEVDAGIGGAAAIAVAGQLARLARERQVLVVTHLAQIAAHADHHYKVEKRVEGGRTVTAVRLLAEGERLEEIARMLSGNTSGAALHHAQELLDSSHAARTE